MQSCGYKLADPIKCSPIWAGTSLARLHGFARRRWRWVSGNGGKLLTEEVLGENPVTVPLCAPQIWRGLIWDWTWPSMVWNRQVTAWAMARPLTWLKFTLIMYTQSVPRSKHTVSVTETNTLMLHRETIAVCSQIHTKHINTLCGQNVELYIKIQSVPRSKHTSSRL